MKDTKSRIRNLLRKFEDLSAIGIANISGTAISTLFWLYLATIISSEEYGEISYLIAIGSIGAVVAQIGGNATITVYAAKKIHISSLSGKKIVIDTSIYLYRFIGDGCLLVNFYGGCPI